jgi:hypothetical protein
MVWQLEQTPVILADTGWQHRTIKRLLSRKDLRDLIPIYPPSSSLEASFGDRFKAKYMPAHFEVQTNNLGLRICWCHYRDVLEYLKMGKIPQAV